MSSTVPSKIQWSDILNESVYTSDDVDIGDVPKGEKIGYIDTPAQTEEHVIYICDPCDNQFKNKEELSRHMSASH